MTEESETLRLPWTGEFTPGQLGADALIETLKIVVACDGVRPQIVEAIRQRWFTEAASKRADSPDDRLKQQRTRSGNVLNGMQSYGLVDDDYRLTALGYDLLREQDAAARNSGFATFLLKHRRGMELLSLAGDVRSRGVRVTKKAVTEEAVRRGYKVTTNSGDAGKLRQWLATAEVVDKNWVVDEARVAELTGTSLATVGEFQSLTRVPRAFLATLRRLGDVRGEVPIPSPELLDFVREEHGRIFDEGYVGRKIYTLLARDGWIVHDVKGGGRGGKGGTITPTQKLLAVDFELLTGFRPGNLPADLRAALTTPLDDVYRELNPKGGTKKELDYRKGIALELLAVNMTVDLGLLPVQLRVRGVRTGGAEVDLVAEGAHLHFSRWLFQCKNVGANVNVGVLAKEIGMATLLQAQVIVIATTSGFSNTVRTYAERVALTTPFQVVLIDGDVLKDYRSGGAMALRERFRRDAAKAMLVKRPQVLDSLDDLTEDGT